MSTNRYISGKGQSGRHVCWVEWGLEETCRLILACKYIYILKNNLTIERLVDNKELFKRNKWKNDMTDNTNGQKKKDKMTNNGPQNITHKHWAILILDMNSGTAEGCSCSMKNTCCVTYVFKILYAILAEITFQKPMKHVHVAVEKHS